MKECGRNEKARECQAALSFSSPVGFKSLEWECCLELAENPISLGEVSWLLPLLPKFDDGFL